MGELIGGHHDVDFPVIRTAKGVIVTRPETINTIKPPSSPTLPQKNVCRLLPPVLHIFWFRELRAFAIVITCSYQCLMWKKKQREHTAQVILKVCEEATDRGMMKSWARSRQKMLCLNRCCNHASRNEGAVEDMWILRCKKMVRYLCFMLCM